MKAKGRSSGKKMMLRRRWRSVVVVVMIISVVIALSKKCGGGEWMNKDTVLHMLKEMTDRLGVWAIPAYVALHTVTLALCLPYAVFFEAGAALLFGFLPAIFCVFSAKILGASLSFWIGRLVFRRSRSAMEWAHRNRYFNILSNGVEQDGWKFVLLARFSPIPSYIINYALAATKVRFVLDFLLPTIIGCLPMILQNTSIGSLAGAAVASATGSRKSIFLSYFFPILGITSSILISLRIKKYTSKMSFVVVPLNPVEFTETQSGYRLQVKLDIE
ncbi:uncharacterized protein LOC124938291 [Impatiens glandulifera]|uniref:uncharacterized protein LOC124938291 n=1 Tax=Impatiens glandulifera TaxID=253017 RepID=UPI001FB10064|nr:uncharacterized protein LOC124938291 [Impatiens glandulifera]